MKKAKWIYFPVVLLLILVLAVSSFAHVSGAGAKDEVNAAFIDGVSYKTKQLVDARGGSSINDSASAVRAKITSFLGSSGLGIATSRNSSLKYEKDEDDNVVAEYYIRYTTNEQKAPVYTVQTDKVSFDTLSKMASTYGDDTLYASVDTMVTNVVVYIPGTITTADDDKRGDVILLAAHLDTFHKVPNSPDASDAVTVATMMQQIETIVGGSKTYKNDFVFLFTDSRFDSSLGIYTFLNQFNGYRKTSNDETTESKEQDLNRRVKLAINLDTLGTGDASMLIQTSENNSALVKEYAKAMGGSFSNSFVSDLLKDYQSDFDAMKDISALSLVTFGELKNRGTSADSIDELGSDYIKTLAAKKGSMVTSAISHFGNMTLSNLESDSDVVYFSFLGLFTVTYSSIVSYIMATVLLLMLVGVIVLNVKNNSFSLTKLAKGAACQIIAIAAAMLSTFLVFLAMSLILWGLGLFTFQAIFAFTYFNAGIIVGYILLMSALTSVFYGLIKGTLDIKATDIVRGGAALIVLVAAVLGFACPALATIALIPALAVGAVMLITTAIKPAYKQKTGKDIERLMLYFVAIMIAVPFVLPAVCVMLSLLPTALMSVIMLPITMLLALVVPYLAAIKPAMNRLMAKLPKHTVRVQRIVTRRVEDAAKKGTFTTQTRKEITKEKVSWKYRHGVLMSVVAVVAAIIIMASSSFASSPAIASVYGLDNHNQITSTFFDNSLVLSWSNTSGSAAASTQKTLQIRDKSLYNELSSLLNDYEWDSEAGGYVKSSGINWLVSSPTMHSPSDAETQRIAISPADTGHRVVYEVKLFGAANIDYVRVLRNNDDNSQIMRVDNEGKDEIVIRVMDQTDIVLDINYLSGKAQRNIDVLFTQYVWVSQESLSTLINYSKDFGSVQNHFAHETSKNVRFGLYFEYMQTIAYTYIP